MVVWAPLWILVVRVQTLTTLVECRTAPQTEPNNPEQLVPIQAELTQTEMPKRINLREGGLRRSALQAEIRTQKNDLSKQVITLFALLSHQCESSMSRLPISLNATHLQCHQTG